MSPAEEDSLSELSGIDVAKQYAHYSNQGPLISFDRPSVSPILSGLHPNDKNYKRALSIIEKGKERLQDNPPSDMPGFKITKENNPADRWHEDMYQYLHWIEMRNRKAKREGEKIYDTDQPVFEEWMKKRHSLKKGRTVLYPGLFFKKMPKSVLQGNWYYGVDFELGKFKDPTKKTVNFYNDLEAYGYDHTERQ